MKRNIIALAILTSMLLAGCGQVESVSVANSDKTAKPAATASDVTGSDNTAEAASQGTLGTDSTPENVSAEAASQSQQPTGNAPVAGSTSGAEPTEFEIASDPKKPTYNDPDFPNLSSGIIWSKYSSYYEISYLDEEPPMGGYFMDSELTQAIQDHPDGLFSVRVDVHSPDKFTKIDTFLESYSDGTISYKNVISQMEALESERDNLKTTCGSDYSAYERRLAEINAKMDALDKKRSEMRFAAEQNYLKEEAGRLAACSGVIVRGVTGNMGYTNYIQVTVNADTISKMPFGANVGYWLYLDCK